MDSLLDCVELPGGLNLVAYDAGFVDPKDEGKVVFFLERTTQWSEDSVEISRLQARALFHLRPGDYTSWSNWNIMLDSRTMTYSST
tara:strand:+ start:100 stop:357 length:258 start_codon:yes stop_codon:yes gene_type:complete